MGDFDDVLQPVEVDDEHDSYDSTLDREYIEEVEAFHAEREAVADTIEHLEEMYHRWRASVLYEDTVEEAYTTAQTIVHEHTFLTMEYERDEDDLADATDAVYFFTHDTPLKPLDGLFLSAVVEKADEPVTVTGVSDIGFLGYQNTGTIEVEGSVGPAAGYKNTGTITVAGDAGQFAAAAMEGGELSVEGTVGDYLAQGLQGGTVRIGGDAGARAGQRMAGGQLEIAGDTGPYTGQDADLAEIPGGDITVLGEADVSVRAPDGLASGDGQGTGRLRGMAARGWERIDSYLDADQGVVERGKDRLVAYLSDPDTGSFRSGLVYGTVWWTQVPGMAYELGVGLYDMLRSNHRKRADISLQSKYRPDFDSKLETGLWSGGMVAGFAAAAIIDKGVKVALGTQVPQMSVGWATDLEWFSNETVLVAGLAIDGTEGVERGVQRLAGRIDEGYALPSSPETLYTRLHADA